MANGLKPVRRLIESSNIDPPVASEMNRSISGHRHSSTAQHW
jgi:hypothetical protein